jgi:hypothetical protein
MLIALVRTLSLDNGSDGLATTAPSSPAKTLERDAGRQRLPVSDWSDPLDDEIDEAADRLRWLAADSTGVDVSLSNLSQRLESMADDLINESL